MRILFLADPFLPVPPRRYGGIERIAASVIRSAQANGHEVMLLAHPESALPGVPVHPLRGGANPDAEDDLRNITRIRSALRQFRPELIHSFARIAYLAPFLPSITPKIIAFHREPTPWTVRWAARLGGEHVIFTGCSDFITARGRAHGGTWVSVPNAIDLDRFTFQAKVREDAPLVFLSRIERVKGAHHAIAAARATGRKLILAGNHADAGPEGEYWSRDIAPYLGREGISFIGPVDDEQKNKLLGSAAALLVPIEWDEPFGLVFAEALACGTPVISIKRGALPEIVEHGREGFLCAQTDELASAITKIAGIRRSDCREKAAQSLSSDLMSTRHEFLYKSLDGLKLHKAKHVHEDAEF